MESCDGPRLTINDDQMMVTNSGSYCLTHLSIQFTNKMLHDGFVIQQNETENNNNGESNVVDEGLMVNS